MEKVRRLLSILIMVMMTAAPCVSFATEEGAFAAPGNESAATVTAEESGDSAATVAADESNGDDPAEVKEDAEAAAPETPAEPGGLSDELPVGTTEVTAVDSVEELSEESEAAYDNDAFFTIDVSKDDSAELATDEVSEDVTDILSGGGSATEKQDEIVDALEDSGLYRAEGSGKSKVEVTSKFAYQRLRLAAPQDTEINAYGATRAVYFEDSYQLSYDSMDATIITARINEVILSFFIRNSPFLKVFVFASLDKLPNIVYHKICCVCP